MTIRKPCDRLASFVVGGSSLLAAFTLASAPGIVVIGAEQALAAETEKPAVESKPPPAEEATEEQREEWRERMLKTPKPENGCYSATYPDTTWHEVPCGKPNGKLYPPKAGAITRPDQVGGSGPDFSAEVAHVSLRKALSTASPV